MAYQRHQIERDALAFQPLAIAGEVGKDLVWCGRAEQTAEMSSQQFGGGGVRRRIERETAIADDNACDALQRLFRPLRLTQEGDVVVAMGVDEAGREVAAVRLDYLGIIGGQGRGNRRDAPLVDAEIATEPGSAGAIQDACVTDELRLHADASRRLVSARDR